VTNTESLAAEPEPLWGHSELTRERLIDVAVQLVEEQGLEALTLRRLGARCGVSAMTPYRHIKTKEELLGALADRYLSELDLPQPTECAWDEYLRRLFRAVLAILMRHPALVTIVGKQHVNGLAGFRAGEAVLSVLDGAGLPPDVAIAGFASLTAFTVGFAMQEMPSPAREAQFAERLATVNELPADEFTHVRAHADAFVNRASDHNFEIGLNLMISGLRVAARP
jgi:AcrR family transcriptional regulator